LLKHRLSSTALLLQHEVVAASELLVCGGELLEEDPMPSVAHYLTAHHWPNHWDSGLSTQQRTATAAAVGSLRPYLFVAGNFLRRMTHDTMVMTAMQDIQMPGPMKMDLVWVWMAVMMRGVCRTAAAAA
jgi:hypothetical protein